jgi:hypothetical protein
MIPEVVNQDHACGAVVAGLDGLVDDFRVRGQLLASEDAPLIISLRFMAQHQNDLALDVDPFIVVVVIGYKLGTPTGAAQSA